MASGYDIKRCTNLSTSDSFQFAFHCELCGKGVKSQVYSFAIGGHDVPLDASSRALLWVRQHDEAYVRASSESRFEFNVCPVCGRKVCPDCFRMTSKGTAGRCLACYAKRKIATGPCFPQVIESEKPEGGENQMLPPVTRRYVDLSTHGSFAFAFYCDRCGSEWRSDTYLFDERGFEPPMDECIRTMLWSQQHDNAYERANCEAGARFNRCTICGSRVCDDCLYCGPAVQPMSPTSYAPSTSPPSMPISPLHAAGNGGSCKDCEYETPDAYH